jgi:hypothetical protein
MPLTIVSKTTLKWGQVGWGTPVIPALRRQRQENFKFENLSQKKKKKKVFSKS